MNDFRRMVVNRSRYVSTLLAAGALVLAGCASSGGSTGGVTGGVEEALDENDYHRSAELFLTQAESLGAVERFREALDAALSAIAEDPGNARGYYQAARAQIGLRDYVAADTLFTRTVELFPDYEDDVQLQREAGWITAYNAYIAPADSAAAADASARRGLIEVAVDRLEAAERIYGNRRPEALINLGAFYNQLERPEDAIDAFAAALEVIRAPRIQAMLETADSTLALSWLERETVVTFNRAQLLSDAERYEEAAAEYATYLETYPTDIQALSNMAAVLSAAGRVEEAQAIYDDLLAGENLGIRDYYNIGVGLYEAEEFTNAASAFGKVVEVAPQNREALFLQVHSLTLAEDYDSCIPVAMSLLDLDPFNAESSRTLGFCLARAGQDQEAIEHLCRSRDPQAPVPPGCETVDPPAFNVGNATLEARAEGGAAIAAEFTNNSLDPDTPVTIRVHFIGEEGTTVGTTSLRVEAPGQGETSVFQADLTSDEQVIGYYFQIIPPR